MIPEKDKRHRRLDPVKISSVGDVEVIWDVVRKKNVVLTPEEMVRQRMIHYLHDEKDYPLSHMGVEKSIRFNQRRKRVDVLIYDNFGEAKMIIELKAPSVKLDQKTISQIASYNFTLQVDYLLLSNGADSFCFNIDKKNNKIIQLKEVPKYGEL